MTATAVSVAELLRDLYPMPGERIKQWVVDLRRYDAWERETCPRVPVASHDDNTGGECRHAGDVAWSHLNHDSCGVCCDLYEATRDREDVRAWIAERAARPPVEADRGKLSDEVQPEPPLMHPMFGLLRSGKLV